MRVEDELLRRPLVEVPVPPRRLIEGDDLDVDRLGDLHLVMQDGHHELAVVAHHRALTGDERVRLRPPQPDADAQVAELGGLVDPTRVAGDIQAGDADRPAGAGHLHEGVEHRRRDLVVGVVTVAAGLETDAVDGRVDLGRTDDGLDLVGERCLGDVDRLAAEAGRLGQAFGDPVPDDHHRRARAGGRRRHKPARPVPAPAT